MRSLYEEIEAYASKCYYPFHMPGHKGNPAFLPPLSLLSLDVTELEETDNLHNPSGCIAETQRRIAEFYGADKSYLLVNGSTAGIIAAICALCKEGDTLAVARNCHRAVYSGMQISGARPLYFMPPEPSPKATATIVTSPSYEGDVLDIAAIAEHVHSQGGILIVDEAHGSHFPFHPVFPQGALKQGADIVVHSFHKTLPAFSQSAVVHVRGDINLRQALAQVQTSSPSYLIMAATDYMLNMLWKDSRYFERYVERLLRLRKSLGGKLINTHDVGKLLLAVEGVKYDGLAFEMLRDDYILAMTSVADTEEGFARLERAMKDAKGTGWEKGFCNFTIPEVVLSPREVMHKKTRRCKLRDAIGEVSAGFIAPFPPGVPLLAPGERVMDLGLDCGIEVVD